MIARDEKFFRERAETMVDGIGYGVTSAFTALASSVTGLVKLPKEGIMKRGIKGGIKGIMYGIFGTITKPVSGGLDLSNDLFFNTKLICSLKNCGRNKEYASNI